ncbi:hypothetical protein SprV_0200725600 [Sparganum proliferum]
MTDRGTSSLPVEHPMYGSAAGAVAADCQSTHDFYPANMPLQGYNTDEMNLAPGGYSLQSCGAGGAEQPEETVNGPPPALYEAAAPKHMATIYQSLKTFINRRVDTRATNIARNLREVIQIAQELLREVELQEPRFINTLKPIVSSGGGGGGEVRTTHINKLGVEAELYEGLRVNSANEFEVILFLNQMGVFNFVDDGSVPGGAVLKLSDGRKRSMSLWVEFITASGYLSARKIRVRFHSLVAQAIDKCAYRGILQLVGQHSEVRIRIRDRYTLQITPAFRCQGLWPRSASHWPSNNRSANPNAWMLWPPPRLISEVKHEGFTLLSQESTYIRDKQTSAEGDAWLLDFHEAEESLLNQGSRQLCLDILTTLVERHLTSNCVTSEEGTQQQHVDECYGTKIGAESPLIYDYYIKTLVLHECEKHPHEEDWTEFTIPDRISGILLQLISCLQHRHCPHYFLPQLNLFRRQTPSAMELAARRTWGLLRTLITCPTAFERL